ncbi:DUF1285 domain-containing protein [Microbulbifer sp. OS29]|uniref:DUF1285 domain-containing protein n=2 Tax=Microbulbifer okhotskensis TaxID=2926617 RepID=A0A9X2J667_9GAMM|nr:DUF1285 domain-containing protein [Microbulbifer okhotskensis]MCO1335114.1 DUF1285 domain-containing protein [Microbulbifer okhotskensis]
MVIKRDGRWIHEGAEIRRQPLVKLFASILKCEKNEYFLVTPAEKLRITVEDVPFVATQVARDPNDTKQCLLLTTNVGDIVELKREAQWQLRDFGSPQQLVPYIEVRNGLKARVSRDVFYQLVDWAREVDSHKGKLFVQSNSFDFLLGDYS